MEASEDDSGHSVLSACKSYSRLDSPGHAGAGHIALKFLPLTKESSPPQGFLALRVLHRRSGLA